MRRGEGFRLYGRAATTHTTPVALRPLDVDEYDEAVEAHAEARYAWERELDERDRHMPEAA